jgi:hypothetical protein
MGTLEPVLDLIGRSQHRDDADDAYEDHWYRVLRAAADRAAAVAEGLNDGGAELDLGDGWLRPRA